MKVEAIHMRQGKDGAITLVGKWPRYARVTAGMLRMPVIQITENGMVKMVCENTWAIYKLAKLQDDDYGINLERHMYSNDTHEEPRDAQKETLHSGTILQPDPTGDGGNGGKPD